MKSKYLVIVVLFLLSVLSVVAQKKSVSVQKYNTAAKKCDDSIIKVRMKRAETLCRNALFVAKQLTDKYKSEKMQAHTKYAFALHARFKKKASFDNYTTALEIGKSFLTESDAELGYAYWNFGRANESISNLAKASEIYQKAEQIYRAAYKKTTDSALKAEYKDSIRSILILQMYIADLLKDYDKVEEVIQKMEDLQKQDN